MALSGTPGDVPVSQRVTPTSRVPAPKGVFRLGVPVEAVFFVGNQLIAASHTGKIGVWNAVTKHWQVSGGLGDKPGGGDTTGGVPPHPPPPQIQDVVPINSYDAAGTFLLLGCNNGSIYYVGEEALGDTAGTTGGGPGGPR